MTIWARQRGLVAESARGVDQAAWDGALVALGGTVFHSSAWARYAVANQPGVTPLFLWVRRDDGKTVAMALAFCSRPLLGGRLAVARACWADALPAIATDSRGAMGDVLALLEASARSRGAATLTVGSFGYCGGAEALPGRGYALRPRMEFELSLEGSEAEVWRALGDKRRNIRRARRLGVVVRDLPAEEAVAALNRLRAESAARIERRGGRPVGQFQPEKFEAVRVLLESGLGRIVGGVVKGTVESAILFTWFNGLVYYAMAGHSRSGLDAQAPSLVIWEAMCRARAEGFQRLNLGGCGTEAVDPRSSEHGLYRYKKACAPSCGVRFLGDYKA